jgi:hypothetical protein
MNVQDPLRREFRDVGKDRINPFPSSPMLFPQVPVMILGPIHRKLFRLVNDARQLLRQAGSRAGIRRHGGQRQNFNPNPRTLWNPSGLV